MDKMDQEKPFKTIEVIDSRTKQACKIACMSCIKGHRTTSCGIPVCRTKVFWTVKRPGRPSNSCTCQYGGRRGCKCVMAKSACPHKAKKGEKRTGECRCDEQGRHCALLEPHHWDELMALQRPTVDFYPTREALEARFTAATLNSPPMTLSFSHHTPQTFNPSSGFTTPLSGPQTVQMMSPAFSGTQSPHSAPLVPRFGMMGIGAPQGSDGAVTPNVLSWDGDVPEAPREHRPTRLQNAQQGEEHSCCQNASNRLTQIQFSHYIPPGPTGAATERPTYLPFSSSMDPSHPSQQRGSPDFDKLSHDYFQYQLPSAICQTCGLNGCTCRNCPPVLQISNGSWAQCCGRKHARTTAYSVPDTEHLYQQSTQAPCYEESQRPQAHQPDFQTPALFINGESFAKGNNSHPNPGTVADGMGDLFEDMGSPLSVPGFETFDLMDEFTVRDGPSDLDLSELLMSELHRPPESECHCGDP